MKQSSSTMLLFSRAYSLKMLEMKRSEEASMEAINISANSFAEEEGALTPVLKAKGKSSFYNPIDIKYDC